MRKHPTLMQFSEHPPMDRGRLCEHWQMREAGEWCVMFDKALDDPTTPCHPRCKAYDPWDCNLEELLTSESEER